MRRTCRFLFIILSLLVIISCRSQRSHSSVLVVAGGHDFDTSAFVEVFRSLDNITFDLVYQPMANAMIASGEAESFDVIVFYDMWNESDQAVQAGMMQLTEKGTGMVFLHHSLAGYQRWPGYISFTGGKYHTGESGLDSAMLSGYHHDIEIPVQVADPDHPVTLGINDFVIHDEGYTNIEVLENVHVLLTASHPRCDTSICWTHRRNESRIVYLMLGHDRHAFEHEFFRQLLNNAIIFTGSEQVI